MEASGATVSLLPLPHPRTGLIFTTYPPSSLPISPTFSIKCPQGSPAHVSFPSQLLSSRSPHNAVPALGSLSGRLYSIQVLPPQPGQGTSSLVPNHAGHSQVAPPHSRWLPRPKTQPLPPIAALFRASLSWARQQGAAGGGRREPPGWAGRDISARLQT